MSKKIIFMGTPKFAVQFLEILNRNNFNIVSVYTQPPKKSHRGLKILKSPVHLSAEKIGLTVRTPDKLNNNLDEYEYIKTLSADLAFVVAYGQIIPKKFLHLTKKGFINLHTSILPNYRGAAPIQRAIMNQETETGISLFKINEKLDEGPVCKSYKVKIDQKDNFAQLIEKLSILASKNIIKDIKCILNDELEFKEQDHSKATYANKILKEETKIDWDNSAKKIIANINGLNGSYFLFEKNRFKILKAKFVDLNGEPGLVVDDKLSIACGNGSIRVLEIQKEGKKPQNVKEFLLGSKIKKGCLLKNE